MFSNSNYFDKETEQQWKICKEYLEKQSDTWKYNSPKDDNWYGRECDINTNSSYLSVRINSSVQQENSMSILEFIMSINFGIIFISYLLRWLLTGKIK